MSDGCEICRGPKAGHHLCAMCRAENDARPETTALAIVLEAAEDWAGEYGFSQRDQAIEVLEAVAVLKSVWPETVTCMEERSRKALAALRDRLGYRPETP